MRDYIHSLAELPEIGKLPDACWVMDFEPLVQGDFSAVDLSGLPEEQAARAEFLVSALQSGNFTFDETMAIVLEIPEIRDIYGEDIVRNENGEITSSKCYLHVRHIDLEDVHGQVAFLHEQQRVSALQPVNQLPGNVENWAFFSFSSFHGYWYVAMDLETFRTLAFLTRCIAICPLGSFTRLQSRSLYSQRSGELLLSASLASLSYHTGLRSVSWAR